MRERPILFSGPMVRAILSGAKTQTRRLMKPRPSDDFVPLAVEWYEPAIERADGLLDAGRPIFGVYGEEEGYRCPYGAPGDRLWVKETHSIVPCSAGVELYPDGWDRSRAPVRQAAGVSQEGVRYRATWDKTHGGRWRPSIYMPRWASRITLEVSGVRVERLQAISEEDARAEGLKGVTKDGKLVKFGIPDRDGWPGQDDDGWEWASWDADPRVAFAGLWDEINGARAPWSSNPWVWVVEFRRVEAAAPALEVA